MLRYLCLLQCFVAMTTSQQILQKVDCGAYDHYVTIDKLYRYTPQVVKIPRCLGRNTNNKFMKCIPEATSNISLLVFKSPGWTEKIQEQHVKCNEHCTLKATDCHSNEVFDMPNCRCKCSYSTDPGTCQSPFYWDQANCRCKCQHDANNFQCSQNKVFDASTCSCVCKLDEVQSCYSQGNYIDTNTCLCSVVKSGVLATSKSRENFEGIPHGTVIIIAIFEMILFIAAIYVFDKYLCKKKPTLKKFSSAEFPSKLQKSLSGGETGYERFKVASTSTVRIDTAEEDCRSITSWKTNETTIH